jgi:nucleotide-binding universal stress UspA family protein
MNAVMPSTHLYLVIGYDGSAPAVRALDTAINLMRGREGSIEVLYVPQLTTAEMMSAAAVAETEATFDEIAQDLRAQAAEQLRGRDDRWVFARGRGTITNVLIGSAEKIRDDRPGNNVAIVVGSSSQAVHRLVGSVAISLARRAPLPVLIVP